MWFPPEASYFFQIVPGQSLPVKVANAMIAGMAPHVADELSPVEIPTQPAHPVLSSRWWLAGVAILALLGVTAGLYANRFGPDLLTDSAVYISAGMRLAHGQGVSDPNFLGPPRAMSVFPPLYPAIIAGFDLLHLRLTHAIGVFNAVCWGLMVGSVGLTAWHSTGRNGLLAVMASAVVLTNSAIYSIHANALSEPPAILLMLAAMACAAAWADRGRLRWAAASGILVACAILTRYAALPMVGAAVLLFLVTTDVSWRRRGLAAGLFVAIALAPALLWTHFHRNPGELPGQRTIAWHPITSAKVDEGLKTLASFVLPENLPWRPGAMVTLIVAAGILLILSVVAAFQLGIGRGRTSDRQRRLPRLVCVAALFLILYPPLPIISICLTDTGIPLDWRILSPLVPPLAIVLAWLLHASLWRQTRAWPRIVAIVLAVLLLASHAVGTFGMVLQRADESDLVWSDDRPSETLDEVRALRPIRSCIAITRDCYTC